MEVKGNFLRRLVATSGPRKGGGEEGAVEGGNRSQLIWQMEGYSSLQWMSCSSPRLSMVPHSSPLRFGWPLPHRVYPESSTESPGEEKEEVVEGGRGGGESQPTNRIPGRCWKGEGENTSMDSHREPFSK